MPLEKLGDQQLNIKKIETSVAKPEDFDALAEVDTETWAHTLAYFEADTAKFKGIIDPNVYPDRVLELFPEQSGEIPIPRGRCEQVVKNIKENIEGGEPAQAIGWARQAKILFPEISLKDMGISEELLQKALKNIQWRLEAKQYDAYMQDVIKILVVAPEMRSKIDLGDSVRDAIFDYIRNTGQEFGLYYFDMLANFRILFPQRFQKRGLTELAPLIEKMHVEKQQQQIDELFDDLYVLRILTADHVELTGHGLVFRDDPKGLNITVPPMPQLKQ